LHRQTPTDESEITYTSLVQRIEFGNIERPKKSAPAFLPEHLRVALLKCSQAGQWSPA
jgi:hypothetical protein